MENKIHSKKLDTPWREKMSKERLLGNSQKILIVLQLPIKFSYWNNEQWGAFAIEGNAYKRLTFWNSLHGKTGLECLNLEKQMTISGGNSVFPQWAWVIIWSNNCYFLPSQKGAQGLLLITWLLWESHMYIIKSGWRIGKFLNAAIFLPPTPN